MMLNQVVAASSVLRTIRLLFLAWVLVGIAACGGGSSGTNSTGSSSSANNSSASNSAGSSGSAASSSSADNSTSSSSSDSSDSSSSAASSSSSVAVVAAIDSFYADSYKLAVTGVGTHLTAEFTGTGTINNGVGVITSGVPVYVNPTASNTVYTLTVTSGSNTATRSVTLSRLAGDSVAYAASIPWNPLEGFTLTTLTNGKVLVVGGYGADTADFQDISISDTEHVAYAQLYDPSTDSWSMAASLAADRSYHGAVRLANGKVLIMGGKSFSGGTVSHLANAELYDPATDTWSSAGSMTTMGEYLQAILLDNGKVLVVGGSSDDLTQLYDPSTNSWKALSGRITGRGYQSYTLTRLNSGKILLAGGNGSVAAQLFDPETETWSSIANLAHAVYEGTSQLLTNGKVLLIDTYGSVSAQIYNPDTDVWTEVAAPLYQHTNGSYQYTPIQSALLPDGRVIVIGYGYSETYNPITNTWAGGTGFENVLWNERATFLANGKWLVVGGLNAKGAVTLLTPAVHDFSIPMTEPGVPPAPMPEPRIGHTATLLPDGKILLVGGGTSSYVYDPGTLTWDTDTGLAYNLLGHTATRLANGKVLIVGGLNGSTTLSSAELYDPDTQTWSSAGSMSTARRYHAAALLPDGKVLVVGGISASSTRLSSAELYDPSTNAWTVTGSLSEARTLHTATLLAGGKVLVAGGVNTGGYLASAELYDPTAGTWSSAGSFSGVRARHTATLLTDGRVLLAGGQDSSTTAVMTAQLYDPTNNTWSSAANMTLARYNHTATLLDNGKVLVTGGGLTDNSTLDLYDLVTNSWSSGNLTNSRPAHTATKQQDGRVILMGGSNNEQVYVERY